MKAIPTSVKAQFFAMYLGQKVFKLLGLEHTYERPMEKIYDEDYLELRQVSDLTDEEVKHVANVFDFIPMDEMVIDRLPNHFKIYSKYSEQPDYSHIALYYQGDRFIWDNAAPMLADTERAFIIHDTLRLLGCATSFTYLNEDKKPVTLSVDELIGMKWAIVKK